MFYLLFLLFVTVGVNAGNISGRTYTSHGFNHILGEQYLPVTKIELAITRSDTNFICCIKAREKYCDSKNITLIIESIPDFSLGKTENILLDFECPDILWIDYNIYLEDIYRVKKIAVFSILGILGLLALIVFVIMIYMLLFYKNGITRHVRI